jgi:hypothetical protein
LLRSKIFLICWCPDSAKVKKKMLYSSTFDTLKRAFLGVHKVSVLPFLIYICIHMYMYTVQHISITSAGGVQNTVSSSFPVPVTEKQITFLLR